MPADHQIFTDLNQGQWLWYFHNFQKDQEDEFTLKRDLVEYHASFIEPQAVQKIRDGRKKTIEVDDKSFAQNVQTIFGRPLPGTSNPSTKKEEFSVNWGDIVNSVQEYRDKQNNPDSNNNYKYWLNTEI